MKILNLLSFLLVLGLLQSCNQLEDDLNTLDVPNTVSADLELTLEEEDYDFVEKNFGNFNDEEEAKSLIPDILANNYPQMGDGSSALVHYDIYSPIRIGDENEYELTEEDYEALDQGFGNLSSERDITDAVEYKFTDPGENDVVTLTYEWYCAGCPDQGTLTSKVANYEGNWYVAYAPTDDDYAFMGQSYPNFESRSTARNRIATFLGTKYLFDDPGTIRTSVFTYTFIDDEDERQFVDFLAVFEYDGSAWQPFQDVVQRSLQLGHDGIAWIPDNTIKYTLGGSDYTFIVGEFADSNPGGSGNMGQYGNFSSTAWTKEQITEAIAAVLVDRFPTVEGQKYLVTYSIYEGATIDKTLHLIYTDGAYVEV